MSFALAARELSFVGRDNKLVLEPGAFDAIVGPLTARFEVTTGTAELSRTSFALLAVLPHRDGEMTVRYAS